MKNIFDMILDKLNDNSHDVHFEGNVYFQYMDSHRTGKFEMANIDTEHMTKTYDEWVPVSVLSALPAPGVEANNYVNWQMTLRVALRLPTDTFSADIPSYQALVEGIQNLHGKEIESEGHKAYFVVKPPVNNANLMHGEWWYSFFDLSITTNTVEDGMFTDDLKVWIGTEGFEEHQMEKMVWYKFATTFGIQKESENPMDGTSSLSIPVSRIMQIMIEIYYRGKEVEKELYRVVHGMKSYDTPFYLKYEFDGMTVEKQVFVYQGSQMFDTGGLLSGMSVTLADYLPEEEGE